LNIFYKILLNFIVKENKNKEIAFDEVNDAMNEDYIYHDRFEG